MIIIILKFKISCLIHSIFWDIRILVQYFERRKNNLFYLISDKIRALGFLNGLRDEIFFPQMVAI